MISKNNHNNHNNNNHNNHNNHNNNNHKLQLCLALVKRWSAHPGFRRRQQQPPRWLKHHPLQATKKRKIRIENKNRK